MIITILVYFLILTLITVYNNKTKHFHIFHLMIVQYHKCVGGAFYHILFLQGSFSLDLKGYLTYNGPNKPS